MLDDVETTLRRAVPLPRLAPLTGAIDTLLQLIDAAEDTYERRIAAHLDRAEHTITTRQHDKT